MSSPYGVQQQSSSLSESDLKGRTNQVGWRLPAALLNRLRVIALERQTKPSKLAIVILMQHLSDYSGPVDTAELKRRMIQSRAQGRWH
jgi:hypothetical protein